MADIKITDLAAYTAPTSTDVIPAVDVGNNITKKVTISDLMKNAATGSATNPGISFDGDIDTGLFQPGGDQIGVATNGVEAMRIKSDGTTDFAAAVNSGPIDINTASSSVNGVQLSSGGLVRVQRPSSAASNTAVFSGFNGSTENLTLYSGGSADFAGDVQAGGDPNNGTAVGARVRSPGLIMAARASASNTLWAGYTVGNSTATSTILAGGSASFAGSVSIGGTASANEIEEYEEGTCTVDLTVGGSAAGLTGTDARGTYTRIGDIVIVQINLTISSSDVSGKTGDLLITGLPFASENTTRSNYATAICHITGWDTDYANGSKTIVVTNSANATTLALFSGSRTTGRLDESAFNFSGGFCKLSTTFTYRIP